MLECRVGLSPATLEDSQMEYINMENNNNTGSRVLDQLDAHVQNRLSGYLRDFKLLRRNNGLVLQGHAHTYYAKQLAQHAVMEASIGLPIVANEIEVS